MTQLLLDPSAIIKILNKGTLELAVVIEEASWPEVALKILEFTTASYCIIATSQAKGLQSCGFTRESIWDGTVGRI